MGLKNNAEKQSGAPSKNLEQLRQELLDRFSTTTGKSLTEKDVKGALENAEDKVNEAIKKVEREFDGDLLFQITGFSRLMPAQSPHGKQYQIMMKHILSSPFKKIKTEWDKTIKAAKGKKVPLGSIAGHYRKKLEDNTKIIKIYLDRLTNKSKANKIDDNILVRMWEDPNKKASVLIDAISNLENKDIKEILDSLTWALRGDLKLKDKALKTLEKELKTFPNGKNMDLVWMIISFLSDELRIKVAKDFKGDKKAFLIEGNKKGIYSPVHIKEILNLTDKNYTKYFGKSKEDMQLIFQTVNDFTDEVKSMMGKSYSNKENYLNEKITGKNILTLYAQFFFLTTILGNSASIWAEHRWSAKTVEKILTHPGIIGAGAGFAAVQANKKGRVESSIASKEEREKVEAKNARADLRSVLHGQNGDNWNKFFKTKKGAGASVFFDFVQAQKDKKKNIDTKNLNLVKFLSYLEEQIKNPKRRSLDYKSIKKSFKSVIAINKLSVINPQIRKLAQSFNVLKITGEKYEEVLKNIKKET